MHTSKNLSKNDKKLSVDLNNLNIVFYFKLQQNYVQFRYLKPNDHFGILNISVA